MKRVLLAAGLGVMMCAVAAWAAPQATQPTVATSKNPVVLKKLDSQKQLTPEYTVRPTPPASKVQRNWHEITLHFETYPEWLDDLDMTCYVLVKGKGGTQGTKQMLLKGDVTLVNIAKGKHKNDFFVHPNTLLRYGEIEMVAVVLFQQGQLKGMLSQPPSSKRWWEDHQPVPGLVLRRADTPWALINFDDYEQVKDTPGTGAR
jgi:hypothetical protein